MDELNLQEIEKKLNREFEKGQRLVFWYDAEGSFSDSVDQLCLGDVTILHLTETNAFRTKMLLEHEDTKGKYLIYAPFEKPSVSKNHLEDMLLYSREFYADKLSLIAAEIGLPSRLRSALESLKLFFAVGTVKMKAADKKMAIRRTNEFMERARDLDLSSADTETVWVIAMCVAAKSRNTTVDDLIYAVLSSGDIREQSIMKDFSQYGLEKTFWEICEERFGYTEPKPTLLKMVMSFFAVYTYRDRFDAVPKQWHSAVPDKMKARVSNISVLLENMMNSILYQECFDQLSKIAEEELRAREALIKMPQEELLHISSFAVIDEILIRWMIDRETAEDRNASIAGVPIPEICEERLKLHFGRKYRAEYSALLSGYHLLFAADFVPAETLRDLIRNYCRKDYRIDTEYRKFISAIDEMEDSAEFEELFNLVQNIYITDYLEKIVYKWNVAYKKNELHATIEEQKEFYQNKVKPIREKMAVIISDAFRYEAAKELEERLKEDQNMEVSMSPMLTSLPSITMVGMAQLLPHDEITLTDEKDPKVLLDGRPTISTFQREQILKAANEHACAIDFDSIRGLKGKIKEFTSGKQVIYIYHNRIDSTGESMRTENSVFDATVKSIEELFSLVSWLSKSGNVYRFLITADHGFIYTRKKLAATDKLENAAGKSSFTDRRFIISKEKYDTEGIYAMSLGEILGNSDSRSIMLAKGMSVFKCGGGMNYVHGGASPQEMIVPSIFIRTQKGIVKVEDVKLNLITDIRKITNLRLKLDFYQEQAVSDVIKAAVYRIRFEADDGEIVSNEVIYSADSKDEKPGNRIVTLGFDIKKKSYGNEHKYYLKILKDSKTEMFEEAMSRQVIMDLPFTEDFGFDV